MTKKNGFLAGVLILAALPLWLRFVIPLLERLPSGFQYRADVASYDNFYDPEKGDYVGEKRSVTRFSYDVTSEEKGVLIIRNSFDVHTVTGDKIFAVERLYGIDPYTGEHVLNIGDHDRKGYLFAPRHLRRGEPYTYWHINYDAPAHLAFAGEENLFGLPVYRYDTRYEGIRVDQTNNLKSLPGVGITRGIELEPYLQVWVEPRTGHLVKYMDDTVAYFYDLKTGERLHPWNHFRNSFTTESVRRQVDLALQERTNAILLEQMIPILAVFAALSVILFPLRRKRMVKIVLAFVVVAAIVIEAFLWQSATALSEQHSSVQVEKLRIGVEAGLLASSMWVAEHNGYFQEEGLTVDIKEFSSGRAAFTGMLNDEDLDMATVAQTPITLFSFQRNDYAIVAGMVGSPNDVKVLARKDRNIQAPSDLRGKKIGMTKNTTGHYFLALFLAQHGLQLQDVILEEIDTSILVRALNEGRVDAISTWEPHIYEAKKAMGDTALLFESNGTFREDFYFVTFKEWAKNNPARLQKFLRAIEKAQQFIAANPAESQNIVAKRLHLDPIFVRDVWKDFTFGLFLDQATLLSLEQQARWMMANKITENTMVPNYLDFISFEALETVKPDAISIIR